MQQEGLNFKFSCLFPSSNPNSNLYALVFQGYDVEPLLFRGFREARRASDAARELRVKLLTSCSCDAAGCCAPRVMANFRVSAPGSFEAVSLNRQSRQVFGASSIPWRRSRAPGNHTTAINIAKTAWSVSRHEGLSAP